MKRFTLLLLLMSAAWPVMARELYIVRHGQVGFKQHYDAEVQEWKLTPLGRQQATWLGKYLRDKHRLYFHTPEQLQYLRLHL